VGGVAARGGDGEEEGAEAEPHWLGDSWVVPQTAEWANELWETLGIEGWERGQEPPGWGPDGERLGQELEASEHGAANRGKKLHLGRSGMADSGPNGRTGAAPAW